MSTFVDEILSFSHKYKQSLSFILSHDYWIFHLSFNIQIIVNKRLKRVCKVYKRIIKKRKKLLIIAYFDDIIYKHLLWVDKTLKAEGENDYEKRNSPNLQSHYCEM